MSGGELPRLSPSDNLSRTPIKSGSFCVDFTFSEQTLLSRATCCTVSAFSREDNTKKCTKSREYTDIYHTGKKNSFKCSFIQITFGEISLVSARKCVRLLQHRRFYGQNFLSGKRSYPPRVKLKFLTSATGRRSAALVPHTHEAPSSRHMWQPSARRPRIVVTEVGRLDYSRTLASRPVIP